MDFNKWGLYPWFEESGRSLIHPEDHESLKELIPIGRVFQCIGSDDIYLHLQYRERVYRMKPDLFSVVPAPLKHFDDEVFVKKSGVNIKARVYDIYWHYEDKQPYYFLTYLGKRLSKRYWEKDFL